MLVGSWIIELSLNVTLACHHHRAHALGQEEAAHPCPAAAAAAARGVAGQRRRLGSHPTDRLVRAGLHALRADGAHRALTVTDTHTGYIRYTPYSTMPCGCLQRMVGGYSTNNALPCEIDRPYISGVYCVSQGGVSGRSITTCFVYS
jgi:hypothetical protein